jgi:hypothetical protein
LGVEATELGVEVGAATPAEEGVAVDVEGGGDGGGAVACEEEPEGGEVEGGEMGRGWRMENRGWRGGFVLRLLN